MPKKLLVVAPHADDEILLCGGTIVKLKQKGWNVTAIAVTGNDQAYSGEKSKDHFEKIEKQGKKARERLEYDNFHMLGQQFQDMYVQANGDLMVRLVEVVKSIKPDLIITTHPKCFHTDHRNVAVLMREVTYQAPRKGICGSQSSFPEPILLYGEVNMEGITDMRVEVYSPLTEIELEKKLLALKCYEGFVDEHPNQGSIFTADHGKDWIYSLARMRGMHCGEKYAEVFEVGNFRPVITLEGLFNAQMGSVQKE